MCQARTQNVHGQIHTIDRAKRLITVLKVQVRNARSSTEKLLEFSSDERSFLDLDISTKARSRPPTPL